MKSGVKDALRMLIGAVLGFAVVLVVLHFQNRRSPAEQVAAKAKRVDLVERMRVDLAAESEAEKSAVLAITDDDSVKYADAARAATAALEKERAELNQLLLTAGTAEERSLLAQFSRAFSDLQDVDKELLALAVRNTNLKAFNLAFGPGAAAVESMNTALSRLLSKSAAAPDARDIALFVLGAQTAALRIEALLAPHIAEESNTRMDAIESQMTAQDREVRKNLDGLTALPAFRSDSDLAAAVTAYADFSKLRKEIISLSRENTNVRSLALSLNQKRKLMLSCQDSLSTLEQAILQEPIAGIDYGLPVQPR